MCELVNGPPPTPKYETAHSCGHGDMGCVHPQHVSWKTTSGNQFDSIAHGTFYKKNGWHPRFKLTSQQVKEIRAMENRPSHRKLAVIYGVSADTIGKMLRGDTWKTDERWVGGFHDEPWTHERRARYKNI